MLVQDAREAASSTHLNATFYINLFYYYLEREDSLQRVQCARYKHQHIYIYRLQGPPCPEHIPKCSRCNCEDYEPVCWSSYSL
jgi:hypothetical protein